jgi:hypothetical protein
MTRHSNNDYEQLITVFGITIAAISAFISYRLGADLLSTVKSTVTTIILVVILGFIGKYFAANIWKVISITTNVIWFKWHDTLYSVNDKILTEYNNTIQWGDTTPPVTIWYGESWFVWLIQIMLILSVILIFHKQK